MPAATAQSVVKDNFIIDFGDTQVSRVVFDALRNYNVNNPGNRVSRIWILADGQLHELGLT